jgi:hypothetical protein
MDPDDLISKYIEMGVISIEGIDENGEFLLSLTDKAQELAPELFEKHKEYAESMMMEWYKNGWINITYDEDLTAYVEMTEAGEKLIKESGKFNF